MSFLHAAGRSKAVTPAILSGGTSAGVFGGSTTLPRRGANELVRIWSTSPWIRLAEDVMASQTAIARWYLLAPALGASRQRALSVKAKVQGYHNPGQRQETIKGLVDEGNLRQVFDHPFLRMKRQGVVSQPWLDMDGYAVDALGQITRDLVGEEILVLARDSQGIPVRWFPIPPTWVELPNAKHPTFRIRYGGGGAPIDVPPNDVAFHKTANPADMYGRGVGPASAIDHDIEIEEQASAYLASMLKNRARPDLLIMAPGMGPREQAELQENWMANLTGSLRQGLVHFLGAPPSVRSSDIVIKDLGRTAADMEMSRMRKDERDTQLLVMNIPPSVVGVIENSNRAVAAAARHTLREMGVLPRLESRRRFLQARFFDARGDRPPEYNEDRLILHYELPPITDAETKVELMKALPMAFEVNDILEMAGKPSVPNGHLHPIPLNFEMRELDQIVRPVGKQQPDAKALKLAIAEVANGEDPRVAAQKHQLSEDEQATLGNVFSLLDASTA